MAIFMYADDLVILSSSVTDLQRMINTCLNEFVALDLCINANKSICIRIGRHHNSVCNRVYINGSPIAWSDQFTYLGVAIKSAAKFTIDLKPRRANFYRSFNSLYSKIFKANEYVVVSLTKTFCIPLFMFSLCAIVLNMKVLNSLDNLMYNALGKIFRTYDHNTLNWCMFYMNCLPPRFEFYNRRINFLNKLNQIENNILLTWLDISGKKELSELHTLMRVNNSNSSLRACIWKCFSENL